MISLDDAFKKFKSRLELNDQQQRDASRRQNEARGYMKEKFTLVDTFLSGSYSRWTKTRPLKDVDIFCVFDSEKEKAYLSKPSKDLLTDVEKFLKTKYGDKNVSAGDTAVQIRFGAQDADEEAPDDNVMSIDIVPAFKVSEGYKVVNTRTSTGWMLTDPTIHYDKAVAANDAFNGEWKPMVKMIKKWNETQGKPIKPSFLIEVMALQILNPPFKGGYELELKSFFATAAERIGETWADPAGLGEPVSSQMNPERIKNAKEKLRAVEKNVARARQLAKEGKNGEALRVWRDDIFGKRFPLS